MAGNGFSAQFDCDNAAFENEDGTFSREEVARILRALADKIEGGQEEGVCHDLNGNRVGNWHLHIESE